MEILRDLTPEGPLEPDRLSGVAALWKREQRQVVTRFGGRSMEPTIRSTDELRLDCGADPQPGDVVAVAGPNGLIVHRLVARWKDWVLTRGDASTLPDFATQSSTVFGRVSEIRREGSSFALVPGPDGPFRRAVARTYLALFRRSPRLANGWLRSLWRLRRLMLSPAIRIRAGWQKLIDAHRGTGLIGVLRRAWNRLFGWFFMLNPVVEWTLHPSQALPCPASPVEIRRVTVEPGSPATEEALDLIGGPRAPRLSQQLFVAVDGKGAVVACSWSASADEGRVRHRGIAVRRDRRGEGIAPALLVYQARSLGCEGVEVILYETGLENRASRRVFHHIGADLRRFGVSLILFRRFHRRVHITGPMERWLRARWERERREVREVTASAR